MRRKSTEYRLTRGGCHLESKSEAMSGSEAVSIVRKAFKSGKTLPVEWRIKQLKAMQRMVEENEVNLV